MTTIARIAAFASALIAASHAAADDWKVIESESRIGFIATYDGIPFDARFNAFDARIRFDPDNIGNALFDVRIDLASVDSDSRDRDEGMKTSEWMAVEEHREARFRAERFERISGRRYRATGVLDLKGTRETVEVPFSWQPGNGGEAVLEAETTVSRRTFGIGSGEWADDDTIGFEVAIQARLALTRE